VNGLNKVCLLGTLGKDPESRSFQNGGKVVELRLATSESWKDRNSGEKKEKTEWHTVKIFNEGLCGVAERFLLKGSIIYVEGKLATRKWQDPQGNDRYSTEVVLQGFDSKLIMMPSKNGGGGASGGGSTGGGSTGGSTFNGGVGGRGGGGFGGGGGFSDDLDDDVPF
jgi:single-strand DNA-binding protein